MGLYVSHLLQYKLTEQLVHPAGCPKGWGRSTDWVCVLGSPES